MVIDINSLGTKASIKMYLISTLNTNTGDKKYYEFTDFVDSIWFMTQKTREGLTCTRYQERDVKIPQDPNLKECFK